MTTTLDRRAEALVGIPWRRGGQDFRPVEGGTDCLQVVREFLRRIGIEAPDPWANVELRLRWEHDAGDVRDDFPPGWRPVPEGDPLRIGDVASTHGGAHLAVHVGGGLALHSSKRHGTAISPIRRLPVDSWWRMQP